MLHKVLRNKRGNIGILLFCVCLFGGCGYKAEPVSAEPDGLSDAEIAQDIDGEMKDSNQQDVRQSDESGLTVKIEKVQKEPEEQEPKPVVPERPKVKGIFVTGAMAGTENMDELIDLVDRTELNAMVIDIKNDEGRITYEMETPLVKELGACKRYIRDIDTLVEKCKEKNIYLIARIVAFKDPYLAQVKPEWCVHNADGSIFTDKSGLAWLNPYQRSVWDYLIDVSKEALAVGFDEIQFDYVRFSTDSGMENVDFGLDVEEKDRREIITEFIQYAAENIHEAGGAISADVYGVVIDSEEDQRIVGQDYKELSKYLDYISPMIYPSHYGPYNYNIPVPDAEPYRLVLTAMQSSKKVLAGILVDTVSGNSLQEGNTEHAEDDSAFENGENALAEDYSMEEPATLQPEEGIRAQVRPWLQDFTATWVKGHINYGADEIRAQIQAVYDAGYEEWILWNASNRYTEEGLLKED